MEAKLMKKFKKLIFLVLFIALSCFISFPVISSENPWDADNGNGSNSGISPDSTTSKDYKILLTASDQGNDGWFTDLLFGFSYHFNYWLYNNYRNDRNQLNSITVNQIESTKELKRKKRMIMR